MFLAAGEGEPVGTKRGGVALGEGGNEVVDLGPAADGVEVGGGDCGGGGDAEGEVGEEGSREEGWFLGDEGES